MTEIEYTGMPLGGKMVFEQDNSLRVSTIGLSQQSINALRMFFRGPCMNSYVLSDDKHADVSIIDMDVYDSKQAWKNHRDKYPNRPVILESIKEPNIEDGVFLRKPIDSKLLKNALNEVRIQLQSVSGIESQKAKIKKTDKKAKKSSTIYKSQKNVKNTKALKTAKQRPLSLIEKIRQIDNGNLAVKNIARLNIEELVEKKIKSDAPATNKTQSDAKILSLVKPNPATDLAANLTTNPTNKEAKKTKRIISISPSNSTIQVGKVNPQIVFDKTANKYIAEEENIGDSKMNTDTAGSDAENVLDATSDTTSSVPLMDGGFNFKDQNSNSSEDDSTPSPSPIKLSIEDAVKKLEELDTSPDTNKSTNDNSEIADKEGIYYNPGNYLQGYLKEAFKLAQLNRKNVLLQGPLQSIIILYQTKQVFLKPNPESSLTVSERSLFALSSVPIIRENITISVLSDSHDDICKEEGLLFDYDPFMWKLATRASRGRIPEGTDLSRHMYLGKMPNIPKPKLSATALKIASLWAEEPCTLLMTSQTLDIPQRDVFTFLSAAWALDLLKFSSLYIEPEFRIGGMDKYIKKQALKKDSLFKKMIRKVRSTRI